MKTALKVFATIILLLAMCFPPWEHTLNHAQAGLIVNPAGNYFILSPPPKAKDVAVFGVRISWKAYGAQVAIGLVFLGAALFFLREDK
jgi:hypothetical protein